MNSTLCHAFIAFECSNQVGNHEVPEVPAAHCSTERKRVSLDAWEGHNRGPLALGCDKDGHGLKQAKGGAPQLTQGVCT